MIAADGDIYLLLGSNVLSFDGTTLTQIGTLTLGTTTTAAAAANTIPTPPEFGTMIAGPAGSLLAVVGDKFYRIDTLTFKIAVTGDLPKLDLPTPAQGGTTPAAGAPAGQHGGRGTAAGGAHTTTAQPAERKNDAQMPDMGGMGMGQPGQPPMGGPGMGGAGMGQPGMGQPGMGMMPPQGAAPGQPAQLLLAGATLYIQRGPQLLAIDTTTGTVTGKAALPQPQQPKAAKTNQPAAKP